MKGRYISTSLRDNSEDNVILHSNRREKLKSGSDLDTSIIVNYVVFNIDVGERERRSCA
jgi:hypothetical protein